MANFQPVVVVHGGAWAVPDSIAEPVLQGVKEAAKESYKLLNTGSTCVDAVVAAVSKLEDDPLYDAGKGSCLNTKGEVEMHAIVMEGKTLSTGGVVSLRNVKNPVLVAKLVLEKTEHSSLSGEGALALARKYGLREMPPEYFITSLAKEELENYLKYSNTVNQLFNKERGHDTVGAVALDKFGNLACATSSGGITAQLPGRVSDTPMVGAGGYADNDSAAVSATGHGESIAKVSLTRLASIYVEQGSSPQESVTKALQFMKRRVSGQGGLIAVDRQGQIGIGFTTERMSWAVIGAKSPSEFHKTFEQNTKQECVMFGIEPNERRTEYLI